MKHHHRWLVVMLILACPQLTACRNTSVTATEEEGGPAKVEHLQGAEPTRVTLT